DRERARRVTGQEGEPGARDREQRARRDAVEHLRGTRRPAREKRELGLSKSEQALVEGPALDRSPAWRSGAVDEIEPFERLAREQVRLGPQERRRAPQQVRVGRGREPVEGLACVVDLEARERDRRLDERVSLLDEPAQRVGSGRDRARVREPLLGLGERVGEGEQERGVLRTVAREVRQLGAPAREERLLEVSDGTVEIDREQPAQTPLEQDDRAQRTRDVEPRAALGRDATTVRLG